MWRVVISVDCELKLPREIARPIARLAYSKIKKPTRDARSELDETPQRNPIPLWRRPTCTPLTTMGVQSNDPSKRRVIAADL